LSKTSLKIRHFPRKKDSNSIQGITIEKVYEKINLITKTCSKPYFSQILKKLAGECFANAIVICDYIIAEQNELQYQKFYKGGENKNTRVAIEFFR